MSSLLLFHAEADLLEWKWSRRPFCRAIRPGGVGITYVEVEKRKVMLESINCTKIDIELLVCAGSRRNPNLVYLGWSAVFLSGPYGEIYEVCPPSEKTRCNDRETYTIHRAIVRGGRGSGRGLRLWGVDEIFEEISLDGFNVLHQAGVRKPVQIYNP